MVLLQGNAKKTYILKTDTNHNPYLNILEQNYDTLNYYSKLDIN